MKLKHNSINFNVADVTALLAINGMEENDVCVVTDENQGGTFIYRSADVATNNGGTIFNGWCRQYEGAINVKWFGNDISTKSLMESTIQSEIDSIQNTILSDQKDVGQVLDITDGVRISTASTGDGPTSYAWFKNITDFPENVTINFNGPTREQIKYLNNFSTSYALAGTTYVGRVPVNESVLSAPYHPSYVLNNKTKLSYNGEANQPAHDIAEAIAAAGGTNTSAYKSIIFSQDEDDHWQILSNGLVGDLTFHKSKVVAGVASDWQRNRLRSYGNYGDWSIQRDNPQYPLDVAGAMRVVGANDNEADNKSRFGTTPQIFIEDPIGAHSIEGVASGRNLELKAMHVAGGASKVSIKCAAADGITTHGIEINETWVRPFVSQTMALGANSYKYARVHSLAYNVGAFNVTVNSGSGSPEGVLTAPVGSMYTDANGGIGTTLYIKESGTGNTGWAAK